MGKKIAVIGTVFLYKVNVVIGAILLFINIQIFGASLFYGGDNTAIFLIRIGFLFLSFIYLIFSINKYAEKIIIYEDGIKIKNLFRGISFKNGEVENVDFWRSPGGKRVIIVKITNRKKPLNINVGHYSESDLLIAGFSTIHF